MFRKGITTVITIVVLLSGFVSYRALEYRTETFPAGASSTFRIVDWENNSSNNQIRENIFTTAENVGLKVGQVIPDLIQNRTLFRVYFPENTPVKQQRSFGSTVQTVYGSASNLKGTTTIGEWYIFGDHTNTGKLLTALKKQGIHVEKGDTAASYPTITKLPADMFAALFSLILLMCTLGIAWGVAAQRRYAIEALHGASLVVKIWFSLRGLCLHFVIVLGALLPIELAICLLHAGASYSIELMAQTLTLGAIFMLVFLTSASLVALLYHQLNPLAALQGASPGRPVFLASWAIHAGLLVVIAALLASTVTAAEQLKNQLQYFAHVDNVDLAVVQLGGAYNEKQQDELGKIAGQWLKKLDTSEQVLLSEEKSVELNGVSQPVLFVNNNYLQYEKLPELKVKAENKAKVILPFGISAAVTKKISKELAQQLTGDTQLQFSVQNAKFYRDYFLYTAPGDYSHRKFLALQNPIVVVVPPGKYGSLNSATSSKSLLLLDGASRQKEVGENPELARYVRAVTPVESFSAGIAVRQAKVMSINISVLIVSIVALILTILAGIIAYMQYAKQWIKVRYLFGWSKMSIYFFCITLEILVISLFCTWKFYFYAQNALLGYGGTIINSEESFIPQLYTVGAVGGLSVLVFTLILNIVHRKYISQVHQI